MPKEPKHWFRAQSEELAKEQARTKFPHKQIVHIEKLKDGVYLVSLKG